MIRAEKMRQDLNLTCLVHTTKEILPIESPDLNRPGMQFCGFYEHFAWERPQIIGNVEMAYLEKLEARERAKVLEAYFHYAIPCVIICRSLTAPPELLSLAEAAGVPVSRLSLSTIFPVNWRPTSSCTAYCWMYTVSGCCSPVAAA